MIIFVFGSRTRSSLTFYNPRCTRALPTFSVHAYILYLHIRVSHKEARRLFLVELTILQHNKT